MKYIFPSLFILIIFTRAFCQPDIGMKASAGKCYAKCLIPDENGNLETIVFEYTGDDINNPYVEVKELKKIIGEKAKRRETIEKIYYVKDTSKIKEFRVRSLGVISEWREKLCESELTIELIENVQKALIARGMDSVKVTGKMDMETKSAISKYQRILGLPICGLDFETLEHLGIEY